MIQKDEIRLTDEITELMEWDLRDSKDIKDVKVYYCDFIPILIGKCNVSNITTMFKHGKDDRLIYFRPMKNGKHCQFLVDYLYEHEGEIEDILISKDKDTKLYSGRIIIEDGSEYKLTDHYTETELKFALFYLYYTGKDITKTIKRIHDADEKFKQEHPVKPKRTRK